jgi:hypothetical protein
MATTAPTVNTKRPASVTTATAALVLNGILDLVNLGGYLSGAPIPLGIVAIEAAIGVAAFVASGGLWGRQRWAVPLALVLAVLNVLLGAVGIFSAGSTEGKAVNTALAVVGLAVLALVAPRAVRRTTV